jgi:hypothetical protein
VPRRSEYPHITAGLWCANNKQSIEELARDHDEQRFILPAVAAIRGVAPGGSSGPGATCHRIARAACIGDRLVKSQVRRSFPRRRNPLPAGCDGEPRGGDVTVDMPDRLVEILREVA